MTYAIAGRPVGLEHPPFVIAEAGVNHDGEVAVAHELVELARRAGADAVKFQTFDPKWLVSDKAGTTPYQQGAGFSGSQSDMLQALTLPMSAWRDLRVHCEDIGVVFLSSPFDLGSARMLVDLGTPVIKVGSGELTNTPFLTSVAAMGVPMILSTGMATMDEVHAGLEACAATPTAVLHCVTSYPAPANECNLRAIPAMRAVLGAEIGWSDHTKSWTTAATSVALGATILEKHITTDRARTGPDHAASLEEADFTQYVQVVREAWTALGDGVKRRVPAEEANARLARRSLHAARDLQPGQVLVADDVVALRPEGGLPPGTDVVGRVTRCTIRRGEQLSDADLDVRR